MSKKLLLADDSITIQKVIQITFAHEDYELTITDNGDNALAKARELKPDLVLADVYMPGKNGYELTLAIKQDPALQHIPVLLLAGSFEPFDEEKAVNCKADSWIEKPFESQHLIDKVAELLSAAPAAPPLASAAPPAEVPRLAVDESDFGKPWPNEPPLAAEPDDPFADISFEDETPEVEPKTAPDDWSDLLSEPDTEPVAAGSSAVAAEIAPGEGDDVFPSLEPQEAAFEPTPPETDAVTGAGDGAFDMDEEEILPLDDDDILGAEDLEPIMEEQTLTPWSRTEADDEDFFGGPIEEDVSFEELLSREPEGGASTEETGELAPGEPAFGVEPEALASSEETLDEATSEAFAEETISTEVGSELTAQEPALADEAGGFSGGEPEFAAPVATAEEPLVEELPADSAPEPAPPVVTAADVAAKAAALGEAEIEAIVTRVVTEVVEKLAGSILERVAWEVVPDLAENLIREEIRKIKDAAA